MVNSNTVNKNFHLIRSLDQVFARFLSFHVCTVNLNTVKSFTKLKPFTCSLIRSVSNLKL